MEPGSGSDTEEDETLPVQFQEQSYDGSVLRSGTHCVEIVRLRKRMLVYGYIGKKIRRGRLFFCVFFCVFVL